MGHESVRSPCVICQKLTAFTDREGHHACLTHGGVLPEAVTRERSFNVILPGKDKFLMEQATEGDSAPADNGGWFAVWMRKLLVDPIQYPIQKSSGKRD